MEVLKLWITYGPVEPYIPQIKSSFIVSYITLKHIYVLDIIQNFRITFEHNIRL